MFIAPTKDPNSVMLRHSASVGAVGSPPRDLLPFFGVNVARRRRGMGETKRKGRGVMIEVQLPGLEA